MLTLTDQVLYAYKGFIIICSQWSESEVVFDVEFIWFCQVRRVCLFFSLTLRPYGVATKHPVKWCDGRTPVPRRSRTSDPFPSVLGVPGPRQTSYSESTARLDTRDTSHHGSYIHLFISYDAARYTHIPGIYLHR